MANYHDYKQTCCIGSLEDVQKLLFIKISNSSRLLELINFRFYGFHEFTQFGTEFFVGLTIIGRVCSRIPWRLRKKTNQIAFFVSFNLGNQSPQQMAHQNQTSQTCQLFSFVCQTLCRINIIFLAPNTQEWEMLLYSTMNSKFDNIFVFKIWFLLLNSNQLFLQSFLRIVSKFKRYDCQTHCFFQSFLNFLLFS